MGNRRGNGERHRNYWSKLLEADLREQSGPWSHRSERKLCPQSGHSRYSGERLHRAQGGNIRILNFLAVSTETTTHWVHDHQRDRRLDAPLGLKTSHREMRRDAKAEQSTSIWINLCSSGFHHAGKILWFTLNKLVGSYVPLILESFSPLLPYAPAMWSASSSGIKLTYALPVACGCIWS